MSGWTLTLKRQPALRVDARSLQPSALAALAKGDIERLTLAQGRDPVPLAEWFDVSPIEGDALVIEGDLSRFDRLGWCMNGGELQLRGNVGAYVGAGMLAGRVAVHGHAADLAGCAMRGGRLEVSGNVGDLAASALPGEMDGMRGGTLVVRGNAGVRLADRMRRGSVVVFGHVGDLLAARMVAGTVAIGGACGAHAAWGMRRGSIVFAGPAPVIAPTFVPVESNADVFWRLLATDLQAHGGVFEGLAMRRVTRHAGDLAVLGKANCCCRPDSRSVSFPTSKRRPMSKDYVSMRRSTVLARDGQFTDAMPEILIGRTDGPVGQAFANMMAQSKGHRDVRDPRLQPAGAAGDDRGAEGDAEGRGQHRPVRRRRAVATADAVIDCVIDGTIPRTIANELCIISLVWIDPRCAKDPNLDKRDMYRTNHEATKLAIKRALNDEPSIEELIANRKTIKHDMDDWS